MKDYRELTRLGQLRRTRQLAEAALAAYGLSAARLKFVQYSANIIYRVDVPASLAVRGGQDPTCPTAICCGSSTRITWRASRGR